MILKFMPSMQPLVLWSWLWWWWLYYKNQTPHILYHVLNPSSLKAVDSMGEEAEPYICPAVLAPGASTVSFQTQVFTKKRKEPVRVNHFKKELKSGSSWLHEPEEFEGPSDIWLSWPPSERWMDCSSETCLSLSAWSVPLYLEGIQVDPCPGPGRRWRRSHLDWPPTDSESPDDAESVQERVINLGLPRVTWLGTQKHYRYINLLFEINRIHITRFKRVGLPFFQNLGSDTNIFTVKEKKRFTTLTMTKASPNKTDLVGVGKWIRWVEWWRRLEL